MSVLKIKNDNNQWIHLPSIKGEQGQDGFSPTATVTKNENAAIITITDKNGTTTATVLDGVAGSQGPQGLQGQNGEDGFSPTVTVTKEDNEAVITITDRNGTTTTTILDGAVGLQGEDGFSPTATVTKEDNVTTISITDKNGTTEASVLDGSIDNSTINVIENKIKNINKKANPIYDSTSCFQDNDQWAIIQTTFDASEDTLFKSLECDINGFQFKTGEGRDVIIGGNCQSLTFVKAGYNLFNKNTLTKNSVINILNGTVEETLENFVTSDFFVAWKKIIIKWLGNGVATDHYQMKIAFYTKDKVFISAQERIPSQDNHLELKNFKETFIVPDNAFYAKVSYIDTQYYYIRFGLIDEIENLDVDFMLAYNQPEIVNITFPKDIGKIFQGSFQLISGDLKVQTKGMIFDNENIAEIIRVVDTQFDDTYLKCYLDTNKISYDILSNIRTGYLFCDRYLSSYFDYEEEQGIKKFFLIIRDEPSDVNTFRESLNEWPIEAVVDFYNPIHYQLPKHDIKTFYRINCVYCVEDKPIIPEAYQNEFYINDSKIHCTYPVDIKLYIDKNINDQKVKTVYIQDTDVSIPIKPNIIYQCNNPVDSINFSDSDIQSGTCEIIFKPNEGMSFPFETDTLCSSNFNGVLDPSKTYKISILNSQYFTITEFVPYMLLNQSNQHSYS